MKENIKILIVDDREVIRDSLKALLYSEMSIEDIQGAEDGEEAIRKIEKEKYDIILMDINMPVLNGVKATMFIKRHYPELKVLGLSMYNDERYVLSMIEAGVSGYILKDAERTELLKAIDIITSGGYYFTDRVHYTQAIKKRIAS